MQPNEPATDPNCVPLFFPHWKHALHRSSLPPATQAAYCRAIIEFLHHCKTQKAPATVLRAKRYLEDSEIGDPAGARDALRWFVRAARAAMVSAVSDGGLVAQSTPASASPAAAMPAAVPRPKEPPRARDDLGGVEWERALIAAVRRKGLLWRTEQTYREWAARFARFIAPRPPRTADQREVGAFLSALAVEQRASQSTQKQALNALVFLFQEAFGRHLHEIPFQRARAEILAGRRNVRMAMVVSLA